MPEAKWFDIYERLPVSLQNVACSLAGIGMRRKRHNRVFWRALDFLEKSQWWSLEEQQSYQNEQLQLVIRHAYDTVPYYHDLMDQRRLKPGDFKTTADLPKLPILDKKTVRERYDALRSRGLSARRRRTAYTGGTTGTSLRLEVDVDTQPWQWAVWWRHRRRFGLDVHQPFIVFGGRNVVPLSSMKPPFWRRNLPMHQTYVSVHHMTSHNMRALIEYLQTRRVAFYSGYPSGLYLLACYLLDANVRLRYPPRAVVTGAETLLPHQREALEKALDTVVADQYGATEQCGNISECELHRYHVDMEFGAVEFLPLKSTVPDLRRIVCTAFHNYAMPLIRYNIGDIATITGDRCSCGRAAPIVARIDGRIESYIITPDGRQLGRLDFLFKSSNNIEEAQLIQNEEDRLIVRLVPGPHYCEHDQAGLLLLLRKYIGDRMHVEFQHVMSIPREPNGKFRQIVSQVFQDRHALSDSSPRPCESS